MLPPDYLLVQNMLKPCLRRLHSKKGLQRIDYVIRFPSELLNSMLWLAAGCLLLFAECTMRGNSTVVGAPASPCLSILLISDQLGAAFFAGLTRYSDAARTYEEARRECECICSDAFTKKVWNVWAPQQLFQTSFTPSIKQALCFTNALVE